MQLEVTHGGALIAGLFSFVSPCVLPLVPPYLCFLAGVTLDELTGGMGEKPARWRVLGSAAAFVLGFTAVFVALGATASVFGRFVTSLLGYQVDLFGMTVGVLPLVTGLIIVGMGLHFLGVFRIAFLHRDTRVHVQKRPAGPFGAFLIGLAFAFGWTPCVGPVLGTILFVAGTETTALRGASLLAAYSLGMGVPFLLAAFFAGPFMQVMARFRRHMGTVERIMGGALVATGILFVTGQMSALSYWLLEAFPQLGQVG